MYRAHVLVVLCILSVALSAQQPVRVSPESLVNLAPKTNTTASADYPKQMNVPYLFLDGKLGNVLEAPKQLAKKNSGFKTIKNSIVFEGATSSIEVPPSVAFVVGYGPLDLAMNMQINRLTVEKNARKQLTSIETFRGSTTVKPDTVVIDVKKHGRASAVDIVPRSPLEDGEYVLWCDDTPYTFRVGNAK